MTVQNDYSEIPKEILRNFQTESQLVLTNIYKTISICI